MFTPGQLSEMLEIPPSTLRRYIKQYSQHLSKTAQRPRGRRFAPEDVTTIQQIRELFAQGRSPEEVGELLRVVSPEDHPTADSALALIPSISKALTESIETARALRSDVTELQTHQSETSQRVEQLENWFRLPWYKRIFSNPPE